MKPTHREREKKRERAEINNKKIKILQTRHAAPAHAQNTPVTNRVSPPPRISDRKPRPPISPVFFFLDPGYENATFKKGNFRLDLLGRKTKEKRRG